MLLKKGLYPIVCTKSILYVVAQPPQLQSNIGMLHSGIFVYFHVYLCQDILFFCNAEFGCFVSVYIKVDFFQKVLAKFYNFSKCHSCEPNLLIIKYDPKVQIILMSLIIYNACKVKKLLIIPQIHI